MDRFLLDQTFFRNADLSLENSQFEALDFNLLNFKRHSRLNYRLKRGKKLIIFLGCYGVDLYTSKVLMQDNLMNSFSVLVHLRSTLDFRGVYVLVVMRNFL